MKFTKSIAVLALLGYMSSSEVQGINITHHHKKHHKHHHKKHHHHHQHELMQEPGAAGDAPPAAPKVPSSEPAKVREEPKEDKKAAPKEEPTEEEKKEAKQAKEDAKVIEEPEGAPKGELPTKEEIKQAESLKKQAEEAKQAAQVSADLQKRAEEEAASNAPPKPQLVPKRPPTAQEKAAALAEEMRKDENKSVKDIIEERELPAKLKAAQAELAVAKSLDEDDEEAQEKKKERDITILAAQADLKSQSKMLASTEKKLKKDPGNEDLQEAVKEVKTALKKSQDTLANDPQPEWDAARASKIALAKKTVQALEAKTNKIQEEKEVIAESVDEKSGAKPVLSAGQVEAAAAEKTNQEKLQEHMRKTNEEEERGKMKEERRLARAEAKNPRPRDFGEEKAQQYDEEVAEEKYRAEMSEVKAQATDARKEVEDRQETIANAAKRIPANCGSGDGECWTANMPERYFRLQMAQQNLGMAHQDSDSSDSDSD